MESRVAPAPACQHTSTALGPRTLHASPANPVPSCAASRDRDALCDAARAGLRRSVRDLAL
eukprot:6192245-Prymnesium_polylepis.1